MGSNIALPALHIQPPPDPSEGIQRMIALKGMLAQQAQQRALMPGQIQAQQQQLQAGAQENALKAQQLKDQQAATAAMQEWDGKDINALPGLMMKHGASAQTVMSTKAGIIKQQQDIANLGKDQLALEKTKNDYFAQQIENVKSLPPEQQPAAFDQAKVDAVKKGHLDPQTAQGMQYQGPEQLDMLEKTLMGHSGVLDTALKTAETEKNTQQAAQAKMNTAKLQAEMNFYQQKGLAPGVPMDAQEAADWLSKNPGKGPADFMKMKAGLVPAINFNLQNQGTTTAAGGNVADTAKRFGYSPVAFDQAAEKYWQTGQLPPSGRGGPALATNKAIQNRAAELHPEGTLAANSAEYHANAESLKKLQGNLDAVSAFENTAKKNIDLLITQGKKIVDSGSPWVNTPLRAVGQQGLGSADLSAFNAARQVAVNEIAKVTSSPGLTGQLSDSARHEVEAFIPANATFAQTVRVAQILKQDMANRHLSYQQQIDDIKGRLKSTSQPPAAVTPTHRFNPATGKIEEIQ